MHSDVCSRTKTRKFSFQYKRSEMKRDKSLSGWYPHGVHLWTKNKNQSLKLIHWFVAELYTGQYTTCKDHRRIFCPTLFLWVYFDEGKISNTINTNNKSRILHICSCISCIVDILTILLKEFILNNSPNKQKQHSVKNKCCGAWQWSQLFRRLRQRKIASSRPSWAT